MVLKSREKLAALKRFNIACCTLHAFERQSNENLSSAIHKVEGVCG
jgi:hypothetical protein